MTVRPLAFAQRSALNVGGSATRWTWGGCNPSIILYGLTWVRVPTAKMCTVVGDGNGNHCSDRAVYAANARNNSVDVPTNLYFGQPENRCLIPGVDKAFFHLTASTTELELTQCPFQQAPCVIVPGL